MTNTSTLRHITLLLALCFTLLAGNAYALDLQTAKAQGYVGEQASGYLGVVKNASGAQTLVNDINSRRKAHYEKIAQRNNGKQLTPSGRRNRDQNMITLDSKYCR